MSVEGFLKSRIVSSLHLLRNGLITRAMGKAAMRSSGVSTGLSVVRGSLAAARYHHVEPQADTLPRLESTEPDAAHWAE